MIDDDNLLEDIRKHLRADKVGAPDSLAVATLLASGYEHRSVEEIREMVRREAAALGVALPDEK